MTILSLQRPLHSSPFFGPPRLLRLAVPVIIVLFLVAIIVPPAATT